MKKYITVIVIAIIACVVTEDLSAQRALDQKPFVRKLDRALDLSPAQEVQVSDALTNARKLYSREDMRNMSESDRLSARKAIRENVVASIEAILSSKQMTDFEKIKSKLIPS